MNKNRAQKDILYISISSFVLVVLWIGFNLYHAHATSTIEPDLQLQIAPIDPRFDTDIIRKLKTREKIAPSYESGIVNAEVSITPSPPATQLPAGTLDAAPSPTNLIERPGQ